MLSSSLALTSATLKETAIMTQPPTQTPSPAAWTFFSNHSHVLLYLAREPDMPLRSAAQAVGITERAVQRIVRDLEEAGI